MRSVSPLGQKQTALAKRYIWRLHILHRAKYTTFDDQRLAITYRYLIKRGMSVSALSYILEMSPTRINRAISTLKAYELRRENAELKKFATFDTGARYLYKCAGDIINATVKKDGKYY